MQLSMNGDDNGDGEREQRVQWSLGLDLNAFLSHDGACIRRATRRVFSLLGLTLSALSRTPSHRLGVEWVGGSAQRSQRSTIHALLVSSDSGERATQLKMERTDPTAADQICAGIGATVF